MRKLLPVFMMSAALVFVGACKTSSKRGIASGSADVHSIADFNYKLSDISTQGVTKEQLFAELDPDRIILPTASICSNRALIWAWNMKRKHNVDSGKIFVFYSRDFFKDDEYRKAAGLSPLEEGEDLEKVWWYHVAPYVVENGKEYVLDGGFPFGKKETPATGITTPWKGRISRPVTINEWLLRFPKTTQCKEISAADTQYTDHMRRGIAFPRPGEGGEARCYVRKIPMQYWTPLSVAMKETGKNAAGVVLNPPFNRETFWQGDIVRACEEAVSEKGAVFGKGERLAGCLRYLGLDQPLPSHAELVPFQPVDGKKLPERVKKSLRRLGAN